MNLTWDGTISAGTILAVLTLLAMGVPLIVRAGVVKEKVETLEGDMREVKPKVDMILAIQTRQDSESKRIDRLEQDIRELRRQGGGKGNA